jgi:hypothetical protein
VQCSLSTATELNGYDYAANNPVTGSDPTGLKACSDDACGPGSDYVDHNGNYHNVAGNNDGCHGCSQSSAHSGGANNGGGSGTCKMKGCGVGKTVNSSHLTLDGVLLIEPQMEGPAVGVEAGILRAEAGEAAQAEAEAATTESRAASKDGG